MSIRQVYRYPYAPRFRGLKKHSQTSRSLRRNQKVFAETHPKTKVEMFRQSINCNKSSCFIDLIASLIDYSVNMGPETSKMYTTCPLEISFPQNFVATFSAVKTFRLPKFAGMVNSHHECQPINETSSLQQRVTVKKAWKFTNAVGRLPIFKMFLQKNHCGQKLSADFVGKIFVFVKRPASTENDTDVPPRLGDKGSSRENNPKMSLNLRRNRKISPILNQNKSRNVFPKYQRNNIFKIHPN